MVTPLVSVVTSTWRRNDMLIERCIPSVQAQTYPRIEHVVVSDGPDPELAARLAAASFPGVVFGQVPEHDPAPHWGHHARRRGLEVARGEYIAYIDDDDALRPGHVATLAALLDSDPGAGFAYTRMASHTPEGEEHLIGVIPPVFGSIGTPMIMHRKEIIEVGTWGPPNPGEDFDLVERWVAAGVRYLHSTDVTVDVWPSAYRGESVKRL